MISLKKKQKTALFVSAVVVAAGASRRMQGLDKQLLELYDVPVVVRSIRQLEACKSISEIVVVCREEQVAAYYQLVQEYGLDRVRCVVKGGKQRQDSVFCGIAACSEQADLFVIHDGARPMVMPQEIEQCIRTAQDCGAAALGWAVKDTIKMCDAEGVIVSTPPREMLYAVATPQVFAAQLYRQAMQKAVVAGASYTDDCQLLEHDGHPVRIVPGSRQNIKITTPEDVEIAQAILACREEEATL